MIFKISRDGGDPVAIEVQSRREFYLTILTYVISFTVPFLIIEYVCNWREFGAVAWGIRILFVIVFALACIRYVTLRGPHNEEIDALESDLLREIARLSPEVQESLELKTRAIVPFNRVRTCLMNVMIFSASMDLDLILG